MNKAETLGQLINDIFETYAEFYDDTDIAATATEVTLNDFLYNAGIARNS